MQRGESFNLPHHSVEMEIVGKNVGDLFDIGRFSRLLAANLTRRPSPLQCDQVAQERDLIRIQMEDERTKVQQMQQFMQERENEYRKREAELVRVLLRKGVLGVGR